MEAFLFWVPWFGGGMNWKIGWISVVARSCDELISIAGRAITNNCMGMGNIGRGHRQDGWYASCNWIYGMGLCIQAYFGRKVGVWTWWQRDIWPCRIGVALNMSLGSNSRQIHILVGCWSLIWDWYLDHTVILGMFPTVQVIFKYCGTVTNVIPEGKFDECGLG